MSFTLPTFNLAVDIYTGPWLSKVLRVSTTGNLAFSKRVQQSWLAGPDWTSTVGVANASLLLPPLTDVRSGLVAPTPDIIEIPSGSSRWYQVLFVEDIGKGFANEHRCAGVTGVSHLFSSVTFAGCVWPVPMP